MEWENARVFISSTFNDMHAERDYLIKEVFPELTEWCERHKIRLTDIDLRWGVTEEESSTNKTIETCLRHVDKSRPFFLCFLGQRRGWVPDFEKDIHQETKDKYEMKRLKNRSATEMEIEHALLEPLHILLREEYQDEYPTPTRHSIFFFRNEDYTKELSPKQRLIYTNEYLYQIDPSDLMSQLKKKDESTYNSILDKLISDFKGSSLKYPQIFSQLINDIKDYNPSFYDDEFMNILVENPLANIDIIAEFRFHNPSLYNEIITNIEKANQSKHDELIEELKTYEYEDIGIKEFFEEFSVLDNNNLFGEIKSQIELENNKEFQIHETQLQEYKNKIQIMDNKNDNDSSMDKVHVIVNDYEGEWDKRLTLSELSHYKFAEGQGKLKDFKSNGKPLSEVIISQFIEQFKLEFKDHLEKVEMEKNLDLDESIVEDIDQQEIFCYLNSEGFIERPEYTNNLKDYVDSEDDNGICLVTAEAGLGKTMLLAKFAMDFNEEYPGKRLYKRFCGASDLSSDIYSLWKSIMGEAEISEDEEFYPKNIDELKRNITQILEAIAGKGDSVIIIDAVNQMPDGVNMIKWFDEIPRNLKLIMSVKEDRNNESFNQMIQNIKARANVGGFEIRELDDAGKKELIKEYLKNYLKSLDDDQINVICDFEGSKNPLFLKILLAELRVFGSFDQLKEKIRSFGDSPLSAFKNVLQRLEEDEDDVNADKIAHLIFSLLANARVGLSEDELKTIIHDKTGLDEKTIQDAIRLNLRQVRPFMARKEGRHDFFYESFKLASQEKYDDLKIQSNESLANYFKSNADLDDDYSFNGDLNNDKNYLRPFNELPYHLDEAQKYDELAKVLSSYDFIKNKLELSDIYNLIRDYQFAKGHEFNQTEDHPIVLIGRALELSSPILNENRDQLPAQLWGRMNGIEDETIEGLLAKIDEGTSGEWLKSKGNALYSPKSSIIKRIKPDGKKDISAIDITDDRKIITCNGDGEIDIFDMELNEFETLENGESRIVKIIPDKENHSLLIAYADGTIKNWDVINRMIIKEDYPKIEVEGGITDIYLSKTYNKIYASSHNGIFTIDLETGELRKEYIESKNYNQILVPRRNEAILVCDEREVDGWDVYEMRKAYNKQHQQNDDEESSTKLDSSEEIRFMGLNKRFLTLISENGQMKFWNTLKNSGGGESIAEERVCSINDKFKQAQTLEDENQIITISDMGVLRVWDIPEPRSPEFTIATNDAGMKLDIQTGITSPTAIDYFSDDEDKWVIVGNENNDVSVIDLEKKVDVEENIRHAESVFSIKTDENHMITASNNGEIFTWDIESEECINQFACDFRFNAISYNRSDSKLVLAGFKTEKDKKINKIAICDVNDGMWQSIETDEDKVELDVDDYKSGMGEVIDIAQTSSGIVFIEEDKLTIGDDEIKLDGTATTLTTDFDSDGVFVGFEDGSVVKYPSGVRFAEIASPVTKITIFNDNVIVGHENGFIEILDLNLSNSVKLAVHDKAITNIFAAESYLVSLSKDNTIKFWNFGGEEWGHVYYLDIFATSISIMGDNLVIGDTLGNVRFFNF